MFYKYYQPPLFRVCDKEALDDLDSAEVLASSRYHLTKGLIVVAQGDWVGGCCTPVPVPTPIPVNIATPQEAKKKGFLLQRLCALAFGARFYKVRAVIVRLGVSVSQYIFLFHGYGSLPLQHSETLTRLEAHMRADAGIIFDQVRC